MTSTRGHLDLGLEGKTAIVTGASSGIGAGTATMLAAAGARVILVGRDADRLADTAHNIATVGGECREIVADITDDGAARRIANEAVAYYGNVDILIHNAGIYSEGLITDATRAELDAEYSLHVRAPFELTQAVLPHLGDKSSIVFIGSNLVHYGMPATAIYSTTKGATETLARQLAVELGPRGIRVNIVAPGPVRTPMTAEITENPDIEAEVTSEIPLGRLGEVSDIAAAVCFLASDIARYTSGATLIMDGARFLS
jgi:NAD(P)-dependent dehydrogenase (short-subunit alcohol dehydrogenase family)